MEVFWLLTIMLLVFTHGVMDVLMVAQMSTHEFQVTTVGSQLLSIKHHLICHLDEGLITFFFLIRFHFSKINLILYSFMKCFCIPNYVFVCFFLIVESQPSDSTPCVCLVLLKHSSFLLLGETD